MWGSLLLLTEILITFDLGGDMSSLSLIMQIGLIPIPEASERRGRLNGIVSPPLHRAPLLAPLCTYGVEKGDGVGSTKVEAGSGAKDLLGVLALLRAGCETRAWSSGCWVRVLFMVV